MIKLRSEENKWSVLDRKTRLKGTEIWIEKNKTYREGKIEWYIKRIAEEGGKKRKKVGIEKKKYG